MYSIKEAAEFLDVSYSTILRWLKVGLIQPDYVFPTGRVRFERETLEAIKQPISIEVATPTRKRNHQKSVRNQLYKYVGIQDV